MIVLDTHVWLWWINGDHKSLKNSWIQTIEQVESVGISAISCFEVALLVQHQRIAIDIAIGDWFDMALKGSGIELLPISPKIAETATSLPEHHSDPQDRIIIATALEYAAQLISADRKFRLYQDIADHLIN